MNKKEWMLLTLAVVLSSAYLVFFTDWFKPKVVHISHTSRPSPMALRLGRNPGPNLMFGLDRSLKLTELEVVSAAAWQTNNKVLPLWHLVSDSNSIPLKMFTYGQRIPGMKPAVSGTRPELLATNTLYRLFITAGKIKGQHDFQLGLQPPAAK